MGKWIELTEVRAEQRFAVNTDSITNFEKAFSVKWADEGMERVEYTRIYYSNARYSDVKETYTQVKQMIMG